MFNNVIVGVDGNDGGRDAIALAKVLVAEHGKLTLAYIYQGDPYLGHRHSPVHDDRGRAPTQELLERERAQASVEAELRWSGAPSIGRGLHELAEASGADLLVVGSSRRGLIGRVLLGDDTRESLNGAPCAVAIAPAGYVANPVVMREIGVAYNGSPESEHALGVARELAAEHHTRLSAFEAVALGAYPYGAGSFIGDIINDMVERARERVSNLDGVEPHAAYGHPAEELALYSASLDLLVVGSRSYGPAGRLVHGSTTQQLARTARCPLLVLTRGAREASPAEGQQGAAGRAQS